MPFDNMTLGYQLLVSTWHSFLFRYADMYTGDSQNSIVHLHCSWNPGFEVWLPWGETSSSSSSSSSMEAGEATWIEEPTGGGVGR